MNSHRGKRRLIYGGQTALDRNALPGCLVRGLAVYAVGTECKYLKWPDLDVHLSLLCELSQHCR